VTGSCFIHRRRGKVEIRRAQGFSEDEVWPVSTGVIARSHFGAWSEWGHGEDDAHQSLVLAQKWRTEENPCMLGREKKGLTGVKAHAESKVGVPSCQRKGGGAATKTRPRWAWAAHGAGARCKLVSLQKWSSQKISNKIWSLRI
jgi:hypothetical protein